MLSPVETTIAAFSLAAWVYLLAFRGGFWRARIRDIRLTAPEPLSWPPVAAVIPARDEAHVIGRSLGSLLAQDYPGRFSIFLVDDGSSDGTAAAAMACAAAMKAEDRVTVLSGRPLPPHWTGKLWALKQGVEAAGASAAAPFYLLLTDADIAYDPAVLRRLVAGAEHGGRVLTSLMVKLRCQSLAERALIPAFVFFFEMLYPFAWVNRRDSRMAAAAGGCMLVRREALRKAGGIEAISSSLIDDCALGRKMKGVGPIWLGLSASAESLRSYPRFADVRRMISRSAYDQLNYSPLLLAGTVLGMLVVYVAPPLVTLFGTGTAWAMAATAWALMSLSFQPILRFYGRSPLWGVALPAISGFYLASTLDSAMQHWRGRGGMWKGRAQARVEAR